MVGEVQQETASYSSICNSNMNVTEKDKMHIWY